MYEADVIDRVPADPRADSTIEKQPRSALKPVIPAQPIHVREATLDDFAFIDVLQKKHSKAVGFLHRQTIESYIKRGDVLVAEEDTHRGEHGEHGGEEDIHRGEHDKNGSDSGPSSSHAPSSASSARSAVHTPLGYIIGCDKYFKREDVGIIYQVNVVPGSQRGLVGALLVREMFARASFGCKLFCCWCAQDLEANYFWEALGFVPIAFRAGSEKKQRMHIFWQKRIRQGDDGPASGGTPWWFPSQTGGGAIREGRLVLPIPPGTHWSDAKPAVLPEIAGVERMIECDANSDGGDDGENDTNDGHEAHSAARPKRSRKKKQKTPEVRTNTGSVVASGGFHFGNATADAETAQTDGDGDGDDAHAKATRKRQPKPKRVYHPKYVAAARELCARYLDEVQRCPELIDQSATPGGGGKYDVSRALEHAPSVMKMMQDECVQGEEGVPLLDAA